jgi:hypothetical protein
VRLGAGASSRLGDAARLRAGWLRGLAAAFGADFVTGADGGFVGTAREDLLGAMAGEENNDFGGKQRRAP